MIAHERAFEWQELFDLAVREAATEGDIMDMGYRVAGVLSLAKWTDDISDLLPRGIVFQEAI